MGHEKRIQEQSHRLKQMGCVFLLLAAIVVITTYFLPNHEGNYWLSANGKKGFYVLSGFFVFLGFYCLGAIWRRKSFLE